MTGGATAPRQARESDLPGIREVIRTAYARYSDRMDRPPAPVLADYHAAVQAGRVWVLGEPVAGVLVLDDVRDGAGDGLLVENVAVRPAAQGAGLGRALMEFAERQARARGLRRLVLYTNEVMVENLAFYAKLGYRETARRTEDGYRRVFMEKRLPDRPGQASESSLPG